MEVEMEFWAVFQVGRDSLESWGIIHFFRRRVRVLRTLE